jgi:hypothetical protein
MGHAQQIPSIAPRSGEHRAIRNDPFISIDTGLPSCHTEVRFSLVESAHGRGPTAVSVFALQVAEIAAGYPNTTQGALIMQRRKIAGMALLAMFALFAIASASASAANPTVTLLSGETFPVTFEGTSGKGTLETVKKTTVKCSAGTSKGTILENKTGETTIIFTGCESSGFKCETTGAGSGEIITSGTTLLVFDSLTTLGVAQLLTVKETVFECTSLVKIKVKGSLLLLITPINTETTKFELIVKQTAGKPSDKAYWNNSTGKEEAPLLLSSINGGAFEESADESAENKITTNKMNTVNG